MEYPASLRYEKETQTIRTVPGNHWVASVDSWDKAIDPAGIAGLMVDAYNKTYGATFEFIAATKDGGL